MANLFNYVMKYGDSSFLEKEFNEIDNLVFSSLSYLDFSKTSINDGIHSLEWIGNEYFQKNSYKKVKRLGIAQHDAYVLLKTVITKKRYQNLIVSDYVYKANKEMQFSALSFYINKHLKYICFEGTDELISGWKEDCKLSYMFPVPAHIEAISYVNEHVSFWGPSVIIGGHSKGGNLALVASMCMKEHKKWKVQVVYNNDGPGLLKKEFESKNFRKLKKKYVHIVPDSSMIGILLLNDCYKVVKSSKKNILGHAMLTWMVEEDHLVLGELSNKSKKLESSILSWLEMHSEEEKSKITNSLFGALEKININDTTDLRKLKNLIKVTLEIKNMDAETKKLVTELITYHYYNLKNS